jgi:flavin reductase (DIM6/NTAB) family NADH-FMN oxidoreductase RutF
MASPPSGHHDRLDHAGVFMNAELTAIAPHARIAPSILYFGTPVVLISTVNEDGTINLAPISSAWALGQSVVLGILEASQTTINLRREGSCVLNLPSEDLWPEVERIAPFTGATDVPAFKSTRGFRTERDKFGIAGLTPIASDLVAPPGVAECPLRLEAELLAAHALHEEPASAAIEVRVVRVHAHEAIVRDERHIDPQQWRPLIYNFRHYFGLSTELGRNWRSET